jgi:hypothetical protein
VIVASGAYAEIEKTAGVDCGANAVCTFAWPRVTPPAGWHQDKAASQEQNINFMVPDGTTGEDAYMYASAATDEDRADTLAGFIADDKKSFLEQHPAMQMTELPTLKTADGQVLPVVQFDPANGDDGRFDIVAYGEEKDGEGNRYYLTFVVSGKTKALRDANLAVFKALVAGYRK